jgi:spoIIIJ-associated protein
MNESQTGERQPEHREEPEASGLTASDGDEDSGAAEPGTATSALEAEGEVAADYLERLLDVADLDGDIDVDIDGDRAAVAIVDSEEGRVSRRLIGAEGVVLEALQELTRLAVLAQTGQRSRLMLDVGGHRAARKASLIAEAQEAVDRVRESGAELALAPMSPFERKVIHDAVSESGLTTASDGLEPHRHVVILPSSDVPRETE